MSRSSHRGHFQASSSSETEDDYLLYQRLDGNGRHIENDIIRIPCSQISNFSSVEIPRGQPLLVNSVNQVTHYHFNINVTIPNVNTTKISRSKLSRSKITQEQKRTSKVSGKASSSEVADDSNRAANSDDEAPSNQENRYKFATIRRHRKPLQRRQRSSMNEESQEGSADSDDDDASNSNHSGSDDEEEVNQEADNSKSLWNQVNYISSNKRKTDCRCSNDQNQTVNPLISVRKSSMKGCRQIQKASASQQCENGCEPFDDYADKSGSANRGNQVNYVTSGKQNAYIRRTNEQNVNAMPKVEQNKHSKSKSRQIQKVSASQQCGNGCDPSDDSADKSESVNLGNQVNYVKSGSQNVNPRIDINQGINAMATLDQNRHFKSKSKQNLDCDNKAIGVITNKF